MYMYPKAGEHCKFESQVPVGQVAAAPCEVLLMSLVLFVISLVFSALISMP